MKNKGFFLKLTALFLILLMSLCLSLVACSETPEEQTGEDETEEPFEPAENNREESELYKRYEEYKENATLAFKNNAPLSKDSFSFEKTDGKVRITKYTGEETIIVIPETIDGVPVVEIAEGTFSGGSIRAVYLPDTVEVIEQGAFDNCNGLATLRLPFIGDGKVNSFVGYIFGADEPDENAIALPPSLDMIIVGDGCEGVSDEAFKGAKTLSAVILPESAEKIGKLAFYQCADLVYVECGGVSEIDEYAFGYCKSLYDIDISSAQKVADGALYSCTALNSITLSFDENDYLGRLFGAESAEYNDEFVPMSLRSVNVAEGCKKIPSRAFYSCKYITEVSLPDSLQTVGIRAFYACRSLGGVIIPDNVKLIDDDAFFGCDNLGELELGASLEIIGMQAFYGCKALKTVVCPESMTTIKASAFYGCESLESVELGGTSKVGKDAFAGCANLSSVDYSGITVDQ